MAEGAPPPPGTDENHVPSVPGKHPQLSFPPPPVPPPSTSQQLVLSQSQDNFATFRSGTYIIQVPKDQIYRVPPPEHATIIEQYRDPAFNKKKPLCCSFYCLGIIAFIVLLVIVIVAVILAMLAKSGDPKFSVERVVINHKKARPDYNVTVTARNPNSRVGIVYKDGGGASLRFKQKTIANGKYPSLYQSGGKSEQVAIVLHGSNIALPKEIEQSMGSQSSTKKKGHRVSLSLNMDIPARMRIGTFKSSSMKFHVTCDISVDTLAKGTRILDQECDTNRK